MLAIIFSPRHAEGEEIEVCEAPEDFVYIDIPEPIFIADEPTVSEVESVVEVTHSTPTNWDHLLEQYDWDVRTARAVLLAESEGNPNAVNWNDHHGSCISSRGLFQIGCFWAEHFGYTVEDLYVPSVNVEIAYRIWKEQGWQPWGVIHDGRYLQYLD